MSATREMFDAVLDEYVGAARSNSQRVTRQAVAWDLTQLFKRREAAAPLDEGASALSPEAAARYAGIGRSNLYQLIGDGEIKIIKIGRRTVIQKSELDAFLARRKGVTNV